jgi:hypothetical protein
MNTDRIAYFLAVVREGSLQAEQQRRQLLHDEKPLSFLNVPVQGRHSGCSSQLCEKYTIHLSKTQTSIQEGGYKDFLYYFQMKMRSASK